MRAIVFGANGQDGYYLCELLRRRGIEAIGVSRAGEWVHGDVSDFAQVERLVGENSPDYVFQLAAKSTTRHDALFENHATISGGALNVLEAVRRHAPAARVFLAGSGLQFVNIGKPIAETDVFAADSPYSVSRIQSVYAARYYRELGVRAYVGYLFHHESPLRKPHHVSKMIALAAKRIAAGSTEMIEMGDITVRKEWTFAGDIAEGILTLVQQEDLFEATIGSGVAFSIADWLQHCFELLDLNWKEHVKLKEGFTPEYSCLLSDPATIRSLGWIPHISFKELALMMLKCP